MFQTLSRHWLKRFLKIREDGSQHQEGPGRGEERSAGGCGTGRNSIGGLVQSKGAFGISGMQAVKRVCPWALRTSKTIPGRSIFAQSIH